MKINSLRHLITLLIIVVASLLNTGHSLAQQKATPRNIFEALEGESPGEGHITINQSEAVRKLVGNVASRYSRVLGREGNTTILMGYRIQFFNGNLPNSRVEARNRATQISLLDSGHNTYISFNAPFWRLLVGDFLTRAEANAARTKLMSILPSWAKDSYVVRDKVRILNYTPPAE